MMTFSLIPNSKGIYKSLVNQDKTIFMMDFDNQDPKFSSELIDYSYNKELYYLERLQHYEWIPELLDYGNRKIYFRWYNNTLEEGVPPDVKSQLTHIVSDLDREQIYKPALYTKYCYCDLNNNIRTFNWYTSSNYNEQPLEIDFFKPILNPDRLSLIEQLATDNKLDMKILIDRAYNEYIEWPQNILPSIYLEVYGKRLKDT